MLCHRRGNFSLRLHSCFPGLVVTTPYLVLWERSSVSAWPATSSLRQNNQNTSNMYHSVYVRSMFRECQNSNVEVVCFHTCVEGAWNCCRADMTSGATCQINTVHTTPSTFQQKTKYRSIVSCVDYINHGQYDKNSS